MIVSNLIEPLQKFNPEDTIQVLRVADDNYDYEILDVTKYGGGTEVSILI